MATAISDTKVGWNMKEHENKLVKDSEIIWKSKYERILEFVINRKSGLYIETDA